MNNHVLQQKYITSMKVILMKSMNCGIYFLLFFKDFIYLLLLRGKEGERERENHQCVFASHAPPCRDLACKPIMCPDWELN